MITFGNLWEFFERENLRYHDRNLKILEKTFGSLKVNEWVSEIVRERER
jgi:hypothetical protein